MTQKTMNAYDEKRLHRINRVFGILKRKGSANKGR